VALDDALGRYTRTILQCADAIVGMSGRWVAPQRPATPQTVVENRVPRASRIVIKSILSHANEVGSVDAELLRIGLPRIRLLCVGVRPRVRRPAVVGPAAEEHTRT